CRCSHPQQGSMRLNIFPFPSAVVVDRWQGHIHNQQRCFKDSCLLSGHTMSQTFIMQFLTNSPSVKGWAALAISATTIKLAFTAASLCDLAFTNTVCCDTSNIFESCSFW